MGKPVRRRPQQGNAEAQRCLQPASRALGMFGAVLDFMGPQKLEVKLSVWKIVDKINFPCAQFCFACVCVRTLV